jgi:hypothetical protein
VQLRPTLCRPTPARIQNRREDIRQRMVQRLDIATPSRLDVVQHHLARHELVARVYRDERAGELDEAFSRQLSLRGEDDGAPRSSGEGGELCGDGET